MNDSRDFNSFSSDSEGAPGAFPSFPVTVSAGNIAILTPNTTFFGGGLGQFVVGTFTANSTSQQVGYFNSEFAIVNGFQLRALAPASVPEPGTALAGVLALGVCGTLRRRRNVTQRVPPVLPSAQPGGTVSKRGLLAALFVQAVVLASASSARAVLFVVPEAALAPPAVNAATIVHFDEIALNAPINGQTIKGFTFLENIPNAIADGGPGNTNHITLPNLVSGGSFNPATYVLTINMPTVETSFGFGFAILTTVPTPNALTITLFDGLNNLGSLTYAGAPDPTFDGGFAGIGSTAGFTSARITFGPTAVAYAIDNVAALAAAPAAVPEPGTALAGVLALGVCAMIRQRRCSPCNAR